MQDTAAKFTQLIEIITRLRAPDGCPWDQKQTPHTFKSYLIEETHELLEAINNDDTDHIREELGDLLFQVIFLNNLYAEQGRCSLNSVIEGITAKMIRRHPHVFGESSAKSEQEVRRQWHAIKAAESKTKLESGNPLESIPKSLPALHRAQRVADRASRTGFDWPNTIGAITKVEEELGELKNAVLSGATDNIYEEMGDLLFALAVLARKSGVESEGALQAATEKFIRRFNRLEEQVAAAGKSIADLDPDSLQNLWRAAKTP